MTTIMFDLQISNFDQAGNMLKNSDSNFIFTTNIAAGIQKVLGWNIVIIDPHKSIINPLRARYDCDIDYYETKVQKFSPTVIWTNDPCRVGAYRTFWQGPLIFYNHWVDNALDPKTEPGMSLFFRQLEAGFKADIGLFNAQFGVNNYLEGLEQWTYRRPTAMLDFVNPPISSDLFERCMDEKKTNKLSLLYNHRLSTARQYSFPAEQLLKLMDILDDKLGPDSYEILISNPSQKQHSLLERSNVVNIYSADYEEYIRRCSSAWVHLNLFNYPGQWSIATAEALSLGILSVIPKHYGYTELAGEYGIDCLTADHIDVNKIANHLIYGTKLNYRNLAQAHYFRERLSPAHVVETQLLPILRGADLV